MTSARKSSVSNDTPTPRRWRQGPVGVGQITGPLTRPALGKRGFAGADLLSHWPAIVGPELSAFACPLEVKYPRGRNAGATLHLRVAHGAAATLLQMKLPAIITRINRFFGYEAVAHVQAQQGPMPARPRSHRPLPPLAAAEAAAVDAQVAHISDTSVKDALAKLGKVLQQRSR